MFARSDTRWAGWKAIDAGDPPSARIAPLSAIADCLQKALPAEPPALEENVVPFAQERRA
mgnify:CR=1 FL=1